MSDEIHIVSDDFEFFLKQSGEGVRLDARKMGDDPVTEQDVDALNVYLDDMGKWETLIDTLKNLSTALNLTHEEPSNNQYGAEKYMANLQLQQGYSEQTFVVNGYICLTQDEFTHRSRNTRETIILPLNEIVEQIQNIPKWRKFKTTLANIMINKNHAFLSTFTR